MSEADSKVDSEPKLRPVDDRLIADFFWSFHHSQGYVYLQGKIMEFVAGQYDNPVDRAAIGSIEDLDKRLKARVDALGLPTEHSDREILRRVAQSHKQGFWRMWTGYLVQLNNVLNDGQGRERDLANQSPIAVPPEKKELLLAAILDGVIKMDYQYVDIGRPDKTKSDLYDSHLQKYVFANARVQTPTYVTMYQQLGDYMRRHSIADGSFVMNAPTTPDQSIVFGRRKMFHEMKVKWESRHPNQDFIPKGYIPKVLTTSANASPPSGPYRT